MADIVAIEQRLQDPPRFLMFSADEAAALGVPILLGVAGKKVVLGIVTGLVLYRLWKALRGDGGLQGLMATIYWFAPRELRLIRALPDSGVIVWRA
jgi:conjugal transfer pilus assembly protein TraL